MNNIIKLGVIVVLVLIIVKLSMSLMHEEPKPIVVEPKVEKKGLFGGVMDDMKDVVTESSEKITDTIKDESKGLLDDIKEAIDK